MELHEKLANISSWGHDVTLGLANGVAVTTLVRKALRKNGAMVGIVVLSKMNQSIVKQIAAARVAVGTADNCVAINLIQT